MEQCTKTEALGNLGPSVNSPYDDYAPALADSSTLVFTSTRSELGTQGMRERFRSSRQSRLFYSIHAGSRWENAQQYILLTNSNDAENAATIAFAPTSLASTTTAVVSLCRTLNGRTDCNLFAIATAAGTGEMLVDLGAAINSDRWEGHPCITPDGRRMYFASERDGGFGGSDVWFVDRLPNGFWSAPTNAGPQVNTADDELSPFYDAATGRIYFAASTPTNGMDIFYAVPGTMERRALPAPYNSPNDEFTPFLSDNILYLASNRPGGCGGYDLYGFSYR